MAHHFETRSVAILLTAVLALGVVGCNKPAESTGAAAPATTVGTEIDDTVVTTTVKSALLADADVKSLDIKVETRKGEVLLSGFVDSQAQIERTLAVVQAVAGVQKVDNKLSLKVADTTVGNKVDDGIVTTRVKAALLADASIKSRDIAVVTRKGEVQLSGFVENQGQIDRALEVTRAVPDVHSVSNEMSLKK